MTASNNQLGGDLTGIVGSEATMNFAPEARPLRPEPTPEDTLELPVHPGIAEEEVPTNSLLKELQRATNLPRIPDEETLHLFETFVRVVRGEPNTESAFEIANKNAEIGQLKELLLEAQETIISLLNDRVLDRAKMSTLEAQVRLLPDLQSQANRAMGLAIRSEDVQQELESVRSEVERLRTSYMRTEQDKKGFFARLFGK
jgi:hypothetical protein